MRLTAERLAFWAGYKEIVLVAAVYLNRWTVVISSESPTNREDQSAGAGGDANTMSKLRPKPVIRSFPRRWLDIHGHEMVDIWDAACRAVMGIIVLHPGESQVCSRTRPLLVRLVTYDLSV